MCPYTYYTQMRDARDPKHLRLQMVLYAQVHGVKPAARAFHTTPKTVRKWRGRYDGTLRSLADRSRAPRRRPRKLSPAAEQRIVRLKEQLPRWSARRLRRDFDLPWSEKAIRRVLRDHRLNRPWRRRKHQTKRSLRHVKRRWRLFQQISVDTKNLSDIPEYWLGLKARRLPRYQYTARDVTTGLLFLAYSDELSLSYATVFIERILRHLKACGIRPHRTTVQTDNGSEFIGSWQAKEPSAFTHAVEHAKATHKTIPVRQHRYQADVETVHSLMETEFYEIETFRDRDHFIRKATTYNLFFNLARRNGSKENQTPWELVRLKRPKAHPLLPLLTPIFLDQLLFEQLHNQHARGYDVWALP
jgi:transposase